MWYDLWNVTGKVRYTIIRSVALGLIGVGGLVGSVLGWIPPVPMIVVLLAGICIGRVCWPLRAKDPK